MAFYAGVLQERPPSGECPECLVALGLIQQTREQLVAIPPSLAGEVLTRPMEQAIDRERSTLAAVRAAMQRAEEVYRDSRRADGEQAVRVISDADVISTTLSAAVGSCRQELLTAQPGGGRPPELLGKALTSDLAALRRGVQQRTIYQHTIRSHGPTLAYTGRVSAAGAEVRTLDEVFDRLIVCDRKIAFVPDPAEERQQVALAIEHPGLIRYLVGIFEHAWERATPLPHSPGEQRPPLLTDDTRRAVLHLMVNGYTDETIAGRLGMSTRSVATHVRKTAEAFGSRSRAQLSYLIAKAGILDEDPPPPPSPLRVPTRAERDEGDSTARRP
ncbi:MULTISPECIES: LuxR C-terminal-related transcriptional regulator [Streptomyces]|uniref:LuxR C-terminal-related transcriptional regulator n=1 Tax=Streptomyces ramulosus TaxID=47762 RepID=A0ABW1FQW5_9ACTN